MMSLTGNYIDTIEAPNKRAPVSHAVFDHDGTISTLREGWETVMQPVMVNAILGGKDDPETRRLVTEKVLAYIDDSTGIQTILQMEALVEMVRDFGFVPDDQILDARGYKEIYNTALLQHIAERRDALAQGKRSPERFSIAGSIPFLQKLSAHGVTLYLASGTDEADVRQEAELMGYASLFNGGIFGAVGDVAKYSKKMVLQRILSENHLSGPELICFGDGPVEIRETRAHGGIAVGVASNEKTGKGLNPEKHARLMRAGAHFIIPDFSDLDQLFADVVCEVAAPSAMQES